MRLDTAKAKTHLLAVELFSGLGDERPAKLQCWWLLRLTNRKIWPTHTVSPAGTQKGKNLVIAAVLEIGSKNTRSSGVSPPLQHSVRCRYRFRQ